MEFCLALPERAGVVAIPAQAFYDSDAGDQLVRWAFCKETAALEQALERLGTRRPHRLSRVRQGCPSGPRRAAAGRLLGCTGRRWLLRSPGGRVRRRGSARSLLWPHAEPLVARRR